MIELTDKEQAALVSLRGGCSCHISPPCSACCTPVTLDELEAIGAPPRRLVEEDLEAHCREVKILESGGGAGPFMTRLATYIRQLYGQTNNLVLASRCIGDAAIDRVVRVGKPVMVTRSIVALDKADNVECSTIDDGPEALESMRRLEPEFRVLRQVSAYYDP